MKLLKFIETLGKLKTLKRSGWKRMQIPEPESVAEHSFRVAVLAMILADKVGVDKNKAVQMGLIHDIGEAEIGDIVTKRGAVTDNELLLQKNIAERKAIVHIFSFVDDDSYIRLFDEYEAKQTKEAQFVKQLDKLEMAIQAYEYESRHKIDLQEFFEDAGGIMEIEDLKKIMDEINALRQK